MLEQTKIVYGDVDIDIVRVYGIEESFIACGYPVKVSQPSLNIVGENTIKRVKKLGTAPSGSGHDCFLKGITVQFDLTAPQYTWLQILRYHFLDVVSSQSKMHKILRFDLDKQCNRYVDAEVIAILQKYIDYYNNYEVYTEMFMENALSQNELWQRILSNTPMGLRLRARVTTNYLQLKTIYNQRRHHRTVEWQMICDWIETLPYFNKIVLNKL